MIVSLLYPHILVFWKNWCFFWRFFCKSFLRKRLMITKLLDKIAQITVKCQLFYDGDPYYIETSLLIYRASQWTVF